jgi:uncharacterized membrane protein
VGLAVTSAPPAGVTASWGANPTSGTSVLTLTASSSAPGATATVTITGTSGSMTVSSNFTVTVHPPSFLLSDAPGILTIDQGAAATSTVTVMPQYGFTGSVSLAVTSALPTGVIASWGTNPTSGTSVLTLTASSSAPAAAVALTITGTSGSLTASTTLNVTVYAPSFTLSASSPNIGQGSSGTSYVYVYSEDGFSGSVNLAVTGLPTGVTASFSPNPTSGSSILTLTASSTASPGNSTPTITGTSGSLTATTTFTLGVFAPGFTMSASSASIGQGNSGTANVYVYPQYGFSGSVNLAVTGLPAGVTASFSPNPTTGNSTLTLSASSTAPIGNATLTVTGTSGALSASTTLAFGVFVPDFTLSDYALLDIGQGSSGTSNVYVSPEYGFSGSVTLAATGLPAGVTAVFSPNPTVGNSAMTVMASSTAAPGQYTATITGTSGNLTHSTTATVAIFAPSFTLSANNVTVGPGSSGTTSVYLYPQYGFNGSVNLAVTGLPSGVTASFSPNPTSGGSTLTLTASSTATPGQYSATVTGTSGTVTASSTFFLTIAAPSFTLSDYFSVSLGQGATSTSTVYVNAQNGFSGSVNLAASNLPSGVTASFSPDPTSGSSTLTLTASSTATPGQYNITITGTSGNLTASTVLSVAVAVPSFTMTAYNTSVGQGGSGTTSVYVGGQNGFNGSVTLAVTGLPSGVTASFSPNPTTYSSTITLTASSSVPLGQYTVTVTGASGSLSASTTFTLSVLAPSFTLSAGSVSAGQGSSGTSYVYVYGQNGFAGSVHLAVTGLPSGVTASFSPNPVSTSSSSSLLTLTVSSTAALGTTTLTVTGTSGSLTASTTLTLTVYAPSFTLSDYSSVSIGQGSSATSYVYVNPQNGFTGSVSLSVTGLPSGVTASFSPNPVSATAGSSLLTLTASSTASLGQYNVTVTGASGSLTASTILNVTVYAPSFTLSDYSSVSIGQGSSATSYVGVNPQYGFTGSVHLAVTGLPSGVTATLSPNPISTGNSTLTLTASSTASLGQYNVTITGTSGSLTASTVLTVSVYAPSFTLSDYTNMAIGQGSSGTSYVYINPQYGFAGNVNLVVSGLPSGVTASFSSNPVSATAGPSLLTLTASGTAAIGQYTVTIIGTAGALTSSTTLGVGVYAPTFAVSDSSVSIGQGASVTTYVNVSPEYGFAGNVSLAVTGLPSGVTASFSPNPIATGSSVLTLTASSTAALGQYTATVTGTSGSVTVSTPLIVGVYVPSFTLSDYFSVAIDQGTSGTSTVFVEPQYGFNGAVSFSASGLPSGVTASFAPNPTSTGSSVMTLTASTPSTAGTFTVTITGVSGSITASTTITLTVYPETFTLADAPTEMTLAQGSSGRSTVYVVPQYNFTGSVNFAASGLPSGVTASFAPNPTTGSTVMTLTASSSASLGLATITITGTSGTLVETTPLALTVEAAQATTSTTLTVSSAGAPVTSVAAGSVVTLTAAVSAGSTPLTTGQVRFCDAAAAYCEDTHLLGTAQLTRAGTAVLKFIPAMGSHSYKAVFAGTQSYGGSTSSTAALTVTARSLPQP